MDGQSLNLTEERIEQLRQIFPEVFSEGQIDFNRLRAVLGEYVLSPGEHYELNWAGKAEARREVQRQTTATLIPDLEGSVDFDTAQNIFIEGENLEVLRVLQKSYFGKVKMIYIDPPYNTGNDSFVYPDDFAERLEEYEKRTDKRNSEGFLNKQDLWKKNLRENGHYHSVWLSMMYPRLYLARNLMQEDGVIFVSIDDNEVANLRLLMDEIFGEDNFLGILVINSTPNARDYGHIGKMHEYALLYCKNWEKAVTFELEEKDKKFKYQDKDGGFNIHPLYNSNEAFTPANRANLYYPFYLNPASITELGFFEIGLKKHDDWIEIYPPKSEKNNIQFVWRWGKEKAYDNLNMEIVGYRTEGGDYRIVQKLRHTTKLIRSLQLQTSVSSRRGTAEIEELFGQKIFQFPKPVELVKTLIKVGTNSPDLILDFFSGSATTAQAVLELNAEDNGNRRFILVQMPEPVEEDGQAWKSGHRSIADIGKARIRKVFEGMKNQAAERTKTPELFGASENNAGQVLGFQSYRLQYSNFKIWRNDLEGKDVILNQLQLFQEPLAEYRGKHSALLSELVLKAGLPLTVDITVESVDDCTVFNVDNGRMWVALDNVTPAVFQAAAAARPSAFVTISGLFSGADADEIMANANLQLKDAGVDFKVI